MTTLFEKYGGFAAVHDIMSAFYDKVLDDPQLAVFFDNVDMEHLVAHQTKFVSSLMGGPGEAPDTTLQAAHQGLAIGNADFDRVAELLLETLTDAGMSAGDLAIMADVVGSKRELIVS